MVRLDSKGIEKWLVRVAELGQLETVRHVVDLGPTNIEKAMEAASKNGHEEVADFLESILSKQSPKASKRDETFVCRRCPKARIPRYRLPVNAKH